MEKDNQEKNKKNVTMGVSATIGAVAGAAAGMFFTSADAEAMSVEPESLEETGAPDAITHNSKPSTAAGNNHSGNQDSHKPESQVEENPVDVSENEAEPVIVEPNDTSTNEGPIDHPIAEPTSEPSFFSGDVEVISCERITTEEGSEMDVAVVHVDGHELNVIDVNIDGFADIITYDGNEDGIIADSEIHSVEGMGIEMPSPDTMAVIDPLPGDPLYEDPLSEDPLFCQVGPDELPDYLNDADVNSFMA